MKSHPKPILISEWEFYHPFEPSQQLSFCQISISTASDLIGTQTVVSKHNHLSRFFSYSIHVKPSEPEQIGEDKLMCEAMTQPGFCHE